MIRENPNCTILPLDSRNQDTDSWFLESNGKMVQLGFSLIKNQDPHGLGFCVHRAILFYFRSSESTYKFWLVKVGWLFSGWTVSIWRHGNWTHGARFLIRENPNCKILPLDSRNQESARKSQLHHFTIGFQKPGICSDSWFLESNGKMVQLGFSLIIIVVLSSIERRRTPHFRGGVGL